MIQLTDTAVEGLITAHRAQYVIDVVASWFAIVEHVYGAQPSLPFDAAEHTAHATISQVGDAVEILPEGQLTHLIHCQLLSRERGATDEVLRVAAANFMSVMPATTVGQVLLHVELGLAG